MAFDWFKEHPIKATFIILSIVVLVIVAIIIIYSIADPNSPLGSFMKQIGSTILYGVIIAGSVAVLGLIAFVAKKIFGASSSDKGASGSGDGGGGGGE